MSQITAFAHIFTNANNYSFGSNDYFLRFKALKRLN